MPGDGRHAPGHRLRDARPEGRRPHDDEAGGVRQGDRPSGRGDRRQVGEGRPRGGLVVSKLFLNEDFNLYFDIFILGSDVCL